MKYVANSLCVLIIVGSLGWVGYKWYQSSDSKEPSLVVNEDELDNAISEAIAAAVVPDVSPDVFLDRSIVELADVQWGTSKDFSVSLVNLSTETIVIDSIKTSCKCTSIEGYEKTINSGEDSVLSFSLEAGITIGAKQDSFTVVLASGGEISADIKANIIATYEVSVGEIGFETFQVGQNEVIKPQSVLFSSDKFRITKVESEYPWLRTKLINTGGNSFEIVLSPNVEGIPVGRQQSRLYITTDYEPKEKTTVLAKINVHSPLMPFPARVLLRPERKQTVVFRDSDNKPVNIVSFKNDRSEIGCKVIDGRLEISVKEGWQGSIRVTVSDSDDNKTAVIVQFINL